MDATLIRRAAPMVYGLAIVVCLLFAHGALLAVIVVGALLVGLAYYLTGGGATGTGRTRDRNRSRR